MLILKNVTMTFTGSFGITKTGKTVVVTVLDENGSPTVVGFTAGSVVELGQGVYAVKITFSTAFSGYVKFNNTTDNLIAFVPFCVDDFADEISVIRKINTNRWKIESNQLKLYDDNGSTVLYTFNLLKVGSANGEEPDERVPV